MSTTKSNGGSKKPHTTNATKSPNPQPPNPPTPRGNGPTTNGNSVQRTTPGIINDDGVFREMVFNMLSRSDLWQNFFGDQRRDIDDECGYPKVDFTAKEYQDLYESDPIACRVVQVLPNECWQITPSIYEDEDPDTETDFEQGLDRITRRLRGELNWYMGEEGNPLWDILRRADVISGVGRYGIIMIGTDDGLPYDEPAQFVNVKPYTGAPGSASDPKGHIRSSDKSKVAKSSPETGNPSGGLTPINDLTDKYESPSYSAGVGPNPFTAPKPPQQVQTKPKQSNPPDRGKPGTDVAFIRVYSEANAYVSQWDTDPYSPRNGQPIMYQVHSFTPGSWEQTNAPNTSFNVHWTRVVHIADNLDSNEILGRSRLKPPRNRILDARKLYGGSAEMYWKGALPITSLETNPGAAGQVKVDMSALRDMMESAQNGLQRWIALKGLMAKSLSPTVVDPTPQIEVQLQAICIQIGIPKRIFMGSERGELASSQDDAAWNDRLKLRQNTHITTRIIVPLINRLIMLGVLPPPKEGFKVWWPDLTSQSESEKATIAGMYTKALLDYTSGGLDVNMAPQDFWTMFMGRTDEETETIIENALQAQEDKQLEQLLKMQDQANAMPPGTPPPGTPGQQPPGAPGTPPVPPTGAPPVPGQPPGQPKQPSFVNQSSFNELVDDLLEGTDPDEPTYNGWVTLEGGQHVYIGDDGDIHYHGPTKGDAHEHGDSYEPPPSKGSHEHIPPPPKEHVPSAKEPDKQPEPPKQEAPTSSEPKVIDASNKDWQKGISDAKSAADKVVANLSADQKNSLYKYTDTGYEDLNKEMRGCPPDYSCVGGENKKMLDSIGPVLDKAPKFSEPITTYRGIKNMSAETTKGLLDALDKHSQDGTTFKFPNIVSTSMDPAVLRAFGGPASGSGGDTSVMFQIKAKSGLYAEDITPNKGEHEIIQSHNTKYKVSGIHKTEYISQNGVRSERKVVHLEEV